VLINTKRLYALCLVFSGLCTQQTLASTNILNLPPSIFSSYVATLSGGITRATSDHSQTIYLTPEIVKTYDANRSRHTLWDGELFLGIQKTCSQIQAQLGIAFAAAGNMKLSGSIWDDADPQFNNYNYRYSINHKHVALKGKLLIDRGYSVIPWISASAGVGFNQAHDFTNTSTIFQALPQPNFRSHTESSFTYTIGLGVQKPVSENVSIGIGYEFADWGRSQLGHAEGQTTGTGLKLNHLYTNGLFLNITCLA
jgi:opacity protein-like surface antigen